MIRIHKSTTVPVVLATKGVTATKEICALMEANPELFKSKPGKSSKKVQRLPFDETIYGHPEVKAQLKKDQFEKCCFCEGKFVAFSSGDVEHFRTKSAILKEGDRSLTFPAYYWLVYDWSNILFSCEICNRRFKRNRFPLENENDRVTSHLVQDQLSRESHLLINPLLEDPEAHITFEGEIPKAKNYSKRGQLAIDCYGLKRKELNDARFAYLEPIQLVLLSMEAGIDSPDLMEKARTFLLKKCLPDAQFSAMIRANFPDWINI